MLLKGIPYYLFYELICEMNSSKIPSLDFKLAAFWNLEESGKR